MISPINVQSSTLTFNGVLKKTPKNIDNKIKKFDTTRIKNKVQDVFEKVKKEYNELDAETKDRLWDTLGLLIALSFFIGSVVHLWNRFLNNFR